MGACTEPEKKTQSQALRNDLKRVQNANQPPPPPGPPPAQQNVSNTNRTQQPQPPAQYANQPPPPPAPTEHHNHHHNQPPPPPPPPWVQVGMSQQQYHSMMAANAASNASMYYAEPNSPMVPQGCPDCGKMNCEYYVEGWKHKKDKRTAQMIWTRENPDGYSGMQKEYKKPRAAGDMNVMGVAPIKERRAAQLYDHLIGRGQSAVRATPASGGSMEWIDLQKVDHEIVSWPQGSVTTNRSDLDLEEALKATLERYQATQGVLYLKTPDGKAFWINKGDQDLNNKFERYGDDVEALKTLSFEDRSEWFRAQMARSTIREGGELLVTVTRDIEMQSSVDFICPQPMPEMHRVLKVVFLRADGSNETERYDDAGGITKGWIELLKTKIFTELPLFKYDETSDVYRLDPAARRKMADYSKKLEEADENHRESSKRMRSHLQILHFVGRLMAKVLMDGERFPVHLSATIYKSLLQQFLHFQDLMEIDQEWYERMQKARDEPNYVENLGQVFGVDIYDDKDPKRPVWLETKPLKPGGEDVEVTEENKMDWVELRFQYMVRGQFKNELIALLGGFWEVVNPHLIRVFSWQELQMMICGVMTLDFDDWRANTRLLGGFKETDRVVVWFWEILADMSSEEHVKMLQFVTGSQSVPATGFAGLAKTHGLFTLKKVKFGTKAEGGLSMPQAHTCFNTMDLPEFTDKEHMRKMINLARDLGMQNEFIKE